MIWFTKLEPWTTFHLQTLIENDCVEALTFVLLDLESRIPVLSEVTAALAVMADEGTCIMILMSLNKGQSNINPGRNLLTHVSIYVPDKSHMWVSQPVSHLNCFVAIS